jgi:hypothetical protein
LNLYKSIALNIKKGLGEAGTIGQIVGKKKTPKPF